jgi:hypothetical protein
MIEKANLGRGQACVRLTTPPSPRQLPGRIADCRRVYRDIRLKGERESKPVDGLGYMELTGYANSR